MITESFRRNIVHHFWEIQSETRKLIRSGELPNSGLADLERAAKECSSIGWECNSSTELWPSLDELTEVFLRVRRTRRPVSNLSIERIGEIDSRIKTARNSLKTAALFENQPEGHNLSDRWIAINEECDSETEEKIGQISAIMRELLQYLDGLNDPIEKENSALQLRSTCSAIIVQIDKRMVSADLIRQANAEAQSVVSESNQESETTRSALPKEALDLANKTATLTESLLKIFGPYL